MEHRTAVLAGALLLVGASPTFGATLNKAEVEGDTVVVYSTAKKDEGCYSMVTFSYKSGDEREVRRFVCNGFARAEKEFRFCSRTDPGFVDLKIEGAVTGTCG